MAKKQGKSLFIHAEIHRVIDTPDGQPATFVTISSQEVDADKLQGVAVPHDFFRTRDLNIVAGFAGELHVALCHKCKRHIEYPDDLERECPAGGNHEVPIPPAHAVGNPEEYSAKVRDFIADALAELFEEERAAKTEGGEIQKSAGGGRKAKAEENTHRIKLTFLPPTFQTKD